MKSILFFLVCIIIIGCSKAKKKPGYISFETKNDSFLVFAKNSLLCPAFCKIENSKNKAIQKINLNPLEKKKILSFSSSKMDSIKLINNYLFKMYFGKTDIHQYDTLYNYNLPFLKGKRYRVLQGNATNFTHKGSFSKYAIDIKMNIGQTICAIRDGIVIRVTEKYNKGGKSKKYRDKANLIIVYHKDGTFAQYGRLKKNGSLVKVGNFIKKGQAIGYSGNTGMSTEPHLHFAVYKPTENGLNSIPFLLDSISSKKYTKGKYAVND